MRKAENLLIIFFASPPFFFLQRSTVSINFYQINDNFKILTNDEFNKLDSINNEILILDNLNFNSWIYICYSSSLIITPECGCTHIAAACKVPVNIIYDANNFPEVAP